jgi:hypothetical protein
MIEAYKDFLKKEYESYMSDAKECLKKDVGDVSWFIGFADGLNYALYMLEKMESENAKTQL